MHGVLDQLDGFPVARFDDKVDALGLMGRGIDHLIAAEAPRPPRRKAPQPGDIQWLLDRTKKVKQVSECRGWLCIRGRGFEFLDLRLHLRNLRLQLAKLIDRGVIVLTLRGAPFSEA